MPDTIQTPIQQQSAQPKLSFSTPDVKPADIPVTIPDRIKDFVFDTEQLPSSDSSADIVREEPKKVKTTDIEKEESTAEKPTIKEGLEETPVLAKPKQDTRVDKEEGLSKFLKAPTSTEKEEAPAEAEVKTATTGLIKPPDKKVDSFDYSKYSDSEQTVLKNMSNQSREHVAKLMIERKELEQTSKSTIFQHPNAYVLSPEYQQAQQDQHFLGLEAKLWLTELEKCQLGQPFKALKEFDAKTGQPIYHAGEHAASARDEEILRANYQNALRLQQEASGKLAVLPQQFQQNYQRDIGSMQQFRRDKFAWASDTKMQDYTFEGGPSAGKSIKQVRDEVIGLLPPYMRNDIRSDLLGDLVVSLAIRDAELHEARNGKQVAEIKKDEIERGEPSGNTRPRAKNGQFVPGKVTEFNTDGMP